MLRVISIFLTLISMLLLGGCKDASTIVAQGVNAGPSQSQSQSPSKSKNQDHQLWHTVTLDFQGVNTSESHETNPFLYYRLDVIFTHEGGESRQIQGFYAADGNAAQTGADSGNVWQARFTPKRTGKWNYAATLHHGANVALDRAASSEKVEISNSQGSFEVTASDKKRPDFRADKRGQLIAKDGYFVFETSNNIWLKGGTNSPENFLAYEGIDQTYRLENQARKGEASASDKRIHSFEVHKSDFKAGDPTWHGGDSQGIIGAVNYLADKGMNSIYMLTLNLIGDGQDVWPYNSPDTFDRFDVSKLEQWNLVFEHMQSRGVLVHIVLQETENELLLDNGDTGPLRSLYFQEMIARFAHLPGLVWNLGEENGPIHWRPEGQNDKQRRAMAAFFNQRDPYNHPVVIHTHSGVEDKDEMYEQMLGYKPLDGLSLQIEDRQTVFDETRKWRQKSKEADYPWLLTMDEIGRWHTGAVPDDMSGGHASLRQHVLWGHFMAGGAGVEWYFGAHYPQNDLGLEDFSTRQQLWTQTKHALDFFESNVPVGSLEPCPEDLIDRPDVYCAAKESDFFLLYLPESSNGMFNLPSKKYSLLWYDPLEGGDLQYSNNLEIEGKNWINLGFSPNEDGRDWVLMLRAQ